MLNIARGAGVLGATVTGIDLAVPVTDAEFARIIAALGQHGVLRFPNQPISAEALRAFSARFGQLQVLPTAQVPGLPEVSVLSNIVENGRNIGIPDAGQDWHTDMTYNQTVGFVNVLVALKVPMRDGRVLGSTEFANTQAAYDDLPDDLRARLAKATATHDLNKFWEHMRQNKGSTRPPMSEAQRRERPPVSHPVFLTHPISGRKVIYVNPGFTERIDGIDADESDALLEQLYAHILLPKYRYVHQWAVGDLLLWDHIGTWHYAVPDYRADEPRHMIRCQVMADKVFQPGFPAHA